VRKQEGTGLGLALTKRLVEIQKGSITVKSQFGRGSTFEVLLPAALVDGEEPVHHERDYSRLNS
jgi:signal transduction histidine kinase